jgi:cellulose synthase/poly-beta-1,6-N-acetylglucosamine synthase-like glycosyltransferase
MGKIRYLTYGSFIVGIFAVIHILFPRAWSIWLRDFDTFLISPSGGFGVLLGVGIFLFFAFVLLYGINFLASFGKINYPPGSKNYTPAVSVIIPAFNEEKVIGNMLESLHKTNYPKPKIEIIVVASGSSDRTVAICEQYQDRLNLKILTDPLPKKGKPAALNLGLRHVSYDIICVYDADTEFEPNTLQYLIRNFSNPAIVATSGPVLVQNWSDNTLTRGIALEYTYLSGTGLFHEIRARLGRSLWVMGRNYAIRKKTLEEFGGWNEDALTEDLHLSAQLSAAKKKIGYAPEARIYEKAPNTYEVFKKQRRRWVGGYKQGLDTAMKLDKRTVILRNFGMMHYGNEADFSLGAVITSIIFGLIGEFYLMLICFTIFGFVFGTIINAVRKYGNGKYRLLLYYFVFIFIDLTMFSTQFKSIKDLEW